MLRDSPYANNSMWTIDRTLVLELLKTCRPALSGALGADVNDLLTDDGRSAEQLRFFSSRVSRWQTSRSGRTEASLYLCSPTEPAPTARRSSSGPECPRHLRGAGDRR